MLRVPNFEPVVLVTDDNILAARVSALFVRPAQYFPVLDGPRMSRPDADNEIVRRRNAMVMCDPRQVLLGGLPKEAIKGMQEGWKSYTVSNNFDDHVHALRGVVKRPRRAFYWGPSDLGIGLYQARLEGKEFLPGDAKSPNFGVIEAGRHLLIACEAGNEFSQVLASNLAFSCAASFAVFPELPESDRDKWIEDLYALGEGGDASGRLNLIAQRAHLHLRSIDLSPYKMVLFVTAGFPWGIALRATATTHMYLYPDFGRAIIEGTWASQLAERSARTALLVDPHMVEGSEIPIINRALLKNGSLTRVMRGPAARITRIQFLLDLIPHDIIVLASHAGDAPGERITYEYPDAEGLQRRLTVDRALGIGHEPYDDKFGVTEYIRFHSLDGVDWRDKAGKAALPVGSAMTSWRDIGNARDRKNFIVSNEPIARVVGSMAIKLYDGIWLFTSHGFAPECAPLIVNNSCWSWHELSERATFAGARGYVGSLFPVTDAEAQEIGKALFDRHIGKDLPHALWLAQRDVYGQSARRPYVIVGLPYISIRPNISDASRFLDEKYVDGIAHWEDRAKNSPYEEIRNNAERFVAFLKDDLSLFRQNVTHRHTFKP